MLCLFSSAAFRSLLFLQEHIQTIPPTNTIRPITAAARMRICCQRGMELHHPVTASSLSLTKPFSLSNTPLTSSTTTSSSSTSSPLLRVDGEMGVLEAPESWASLMFFKASLYVILRTSTAMAVSTSNDLSFGSDASTSGTDATMDSTNASAASASLESNITYSWITTLPGTTKGMYTLSFGRPLLLAMAAIRSSWMPSDL
mmetsp:Transcript_34119/g.96694  ORF Transcript_34119/g.96694 Transcript_34119/m.96694 type:complete len:201 (+) Transcript_34119:508-1110(+)